MKKQTVKKLLATMLASTMVVSSLVGCTNNTNNTSETETAATEGTTNKDTEAGTQESDGYTDYSNGFDQTVTIKIPVYDRAFEGWNVTDNTYTRWVQSEFGDKYNVNVEYVAIGRSTEVTDYMQMLSAGSAPNIIMHYDMPQAVNYYAEGAMQPLDLDEIAYYAPTYYANTGAITETFGEMDDETYFFFAERPTYYYNYVNVIRKDWLDQVNAEMPTTLEELNEVAELWKEAGLGTIQEQLLQSGFVYYYGHIGTSVDEKELALYSDLNVAPFTWSATESYLRTMNHRYNNELVDTEFYLKDDASKLDAAFVSGEIGTRGFYISSSTDVISSLLVNDAGAELAILPASAYVPSGNNVYYYEYMPYGMIMGINSTSTDEERAAVWMFLDWMSQPENLFKFQHGIEGENYEIDADGLAVHFEDYTGEWKRSNNNNKDYWCLVVEAAVYDDDELTEAARLIDLAPPGYGYLIADSKADWATQQGLLNTAYTKSIEASAEYAADLVELWKELYVKCITVPEDQFDATYQEACEVYLSAGYQAILDEKEALYDAGSIK